MSVSNILKIGTLMVFLSILFLPPNNRYLGFIIFLTLIGLAAILWISKD